MSRPVMRRVFAGVLVLLLLACPASASSQWSRLSSEHFTFVSDLGPREIRGFAARLELFRDVVARRFSVETVPPSTRTVVIIFRDSRSFAPFRPMFDGQPVEVAGYATGSDEVNYIAINAAEKKKADGVLFHEYVHIFLRQRFDEVPLWLSEGLAEFYETFEIGSRGTSGVVGLAAAENIALLASTVAPLTLDQLNDVTPTSSAYNEGSRRGLFYAQSWALVHRLMFGGDEAFDRMQRLLSGAVPATVETIRWLAGEGTSRLGMELFRYTKYQSLKAERLAFTVAADDVPLSAPEALKAGDALSYLADAIAHLGRVDAARAALTNVVGSESTTPRALAALGILEVRDGQAEHGLPLLAQALGEAPELVDAARWYAHALMRRALDEPANAAAWYGDARKALEKALAIGPASPSGVAELAAVELAASRREGGDPARAAALMTPLVDNEPGRHDYRLLLARALMASGDYRRASFHLGTLLARATSTPMRETARTLLAEAARARVAQTAETAAR